MRWSRATFSSGADGVVTVGGSARQVVPSKSPKLGPRQYRAAGAGGLSSNCTRNAISRDSPSSEIAPGVIESLSPVLAREASPGRPQSGPPGRGNSTNRIAATGSAWKISVPTRRSRWRIAGRGCRILR